VRWIPAAASAFGFVGAAIGVLSFWFDGHTVSRGPRAVHSIVNLAHVSAGSVWFGGIVGLVVVGLLRRSRRHSTAPDIIRFSSLATIALIVVTLAGALMTVFVIDGFDDLTGTDWGRILLVKVGAVGVTVAIGAYNHFVVVPALERSDESDMTKRARSTITVEAAVLALVVALTVFLTTASTI
jgi:copper transport protein